MDIRDLLSTRSISQPSPEPAPSSNERGRLPKSDASDSPADPPRSAVDNTRLDVTRPVLGDVFSFLRAPTKGVKERDYDEFCEAADDYFSRCSDNQIMPSLSGLALATGQPSVASFYRLGQRKPEYRDPISRCVTAMSAYMEHGLTDNTLKPQVGIYLLNHLQGFDVEEPAGAKPVTFWSDTKRHEVHVSGVVEHKAGDDLTPQEAYLLVINGGKMPEKMVQELTTSTAQDAEEYFSDVVSEQ